jgi:cell wall-associated NlpC family hydrolase
MKVLKKLVLTTLLLSLALSMLTAFASANSTIAYGAATVNTPSLRLRTGPGLSHSVDMLLSQGDIVVILERTNSEWFRVNFHGNVGYVSVPLLRDILTAENFNAQGRITGSRVNIRMRPNTTSTVLDAFSQGTVMTVVGINDGWYKVQHNGHTGYVRSDFMEIIAGQRAAYVSARVPAVSPAPPANLTKGQQIIDFALGYIGTRYLWGGSSPAGFDCSGFVTYVLRNFGISVTRNASGQFRDNGVHIAQSDLSPGDLVFFSSNGNSVTHVGIYIGDGEFVHASSARSGVVVSQLNSAYHLSVWHGAKRVLT